jgi:hypothetical protein
MLYEGHDKYVKFVAHLQAIKHDLRDLRDGSGMELHGPIHTFKLDFGGDVAFQGGFLWACWGIIYFLLLHLLLGSPKQASQPIRLPPQGHYTAHGQG